MSLKEKVVHIWTYYKARVIAAAVVFAVAVSLIGGMIAGTMEPEPKLQLTVQSNWINEDRLESWKAQVAEQMNLDVDEIRVLTLAAGFTEEMVTEKTAAVYQFAGYIQGKQVDVMLGDAVSMMDSPTPESFVDLREAFTEEEWAQLTQKAESLTTEDYPAVLTGYTMEKESGPSIEFDLELNMKDEGVGCYFICIGQPSEKIIGADTAYAGIPVNAPNMENAKQWIWKSVMGE